ncbi:hypothetical protein HOG98_02910 [bacterium]|nr:hypothetical protein [bacterium]
MKIVKKIISIKPQPNIHLHSNSSLDIYTSSIPSQLIKGKGTLATNSKLALELDKLFDELDQLSINEPKLEKSFTDLKEILIFLCDIREVDKPHKPNNLAKIKDPASYILEDILEIMPELEPKVRAIIEKSLIGIIKENDGLWEKCKDCLPATIIVGILFSLVEFYKVQAQTDNEGTTTDNTEKGILGFINASYRAMQRFTSVTVMEYFDIPAEASFTEKSIGTATGAFVGCIPIIPLDMLKMFINIEAAETGKTNVLESSKTTFNNLDLMALSALPLIVRNMLAFGSLYGLKAGIATLYPALTGTEVLLAALPAYAVYTGLVYPADLFKTIVSEESLKIAEHKRLENNLKKLNQEYQNIEEWISITSKIAPYSGIGQGQILTTTLVEKLNSLSEQIIVEQTETKKLYLKQAKIITNQLSNKNGLLPNNSHQKNELDFLELYSETLENLKKNVSSLKAKTSSSPRPTIQSNLEPDISRVTIPEVNGQMLITARAFGTSSTQGAPPVTKFSTDLMRIRSAISNEKSRLLPTSFKHSIVDKFTNHIGKGKAPPGIGWRILTLLGIPLTAIGVQQLAESRRNKAATIRRTVAS